MPSDKRKLQCYPSPETWEVLETMRDGESEPWGHVIDRLVQGVSPEVSPRDTPQDYESRLTRLEAEVTALKAQLSSLSDTPRGITRYRRRNTPSDTPVIPSDTPSDTPEIPMEVAAIKGLSQYELVSKFGLGHPSVISRLATSRGFESAAEFLASETKWHLVKRRWYPPKEGE